MIYDELNSCENMFSGVTSFYEITLSLNDSITSMNSMFKGCTSLNKTTFLNFDTSNVNDMSHAFDGCTSLIYFI